MTTRIVSVEAPARIHLGLLGSRPGEVCAAGVMIRPPCTRIEFRAAERLTLLAPDAERLRQCVANWLEHWATRRPPPFDDVDRLPVAVRVTRAPASHVGLGSGTQLAMATAAGLTRWFQPEATFGLADAAATGRGRRSSVGTCGFFSGGLVADFGAAAPPGDAVPPVTLDPQWRVFLIRAQGIEGPSGLPEDELLQSLRAPPRDGGRPGRRLLAGDQLAPSLRGASTQAERDSAQGLMELIEAAATRDFPRFSRAVFEFGCRAGRYFHAAQGGLYNGPLVASMIASLSALDVVGVGQSSWGPTVFGFLDSPEAAERVRREMASRWPEPRFWSAVAVPDAHGHVVSETEAPAITMDDAPSP